MTQKERKKERRRKASKQASKQKRENRRLTPQEIYELPVVDNSRSTVVVGALEINEHTSKYSDIRYKNKTHGRNIHKELTVPEAFQNSGCLRKIPT